MTSPYVVSTQWLAEHLAAPDIAIIDASWHLPAAKRDAKAEFLEGTHPRRAVLRHRRDLGQRHRLAAHVAER